MPFMVTMQVQGQKDVADAFAAVRGSLQRKHLRKGLAAAGRKVMWAARAAVPVRSGLLKKALGSKVKRSKVDGHLTAFVGARTGFKRAVGVRTRGARAGKPIYQNPVKYLHLVELGTKRGVSGRHFLQRALDGQRGAIERTLADAVDAAIAEAAKRGGASKGGK